MHRLAHLPDGAQRFGAVGEGENAISLSLEKKLPL